MQRSQLRCADWGERCVHGMGVVRQFIYALSPRSPIGAEYQPPAHPHTPNDGRQARGRAGCWAVSGNNQSVGGKKVCQKRDCGSDWLQQSYIIPSPLPSCPCPSFCVRPDSRKQSVLSDPFPSQSSLRVSVCSRNRKNAHSCFLLRASSCLNHNLYISN